MLQELQLTNFRGFSNHRIPLRQLSVAVGQNNAGKSTIVEALRLLALAGARHNTSAYRKAPRWLDAPVGVQPAIDDLQVNETGLFHRYADPPAVIRAWFSTGERLELFLRNGTELHSVLRNARGRAITSSGQALSLEIPRVAILPELGPIPISEQRLTDAYVVRSALSRLAPMHFRNQLHVFASEIDVFRDLVEETWPGLKILELEVPQLASGEMLSLQIRNQDFVGEVATMGHGVQMWLQVMWFLARERDSGTLILDEPDVHMHPDLQRRLVRLLYRQESQVIVTTHSPEVMAEVAPSEILIIDRRTRASSFADSLPAVQRLIESVGSVQNIQLIRLWRARRFVMVEGDDLSVLKPLQNILFPDSIQPVDTIPNMEVGGWGGWNWAVGSSMSLHNSAGDALTVYCIFDSDYHTDEQIAERRDEAAKKDIELHIWKRKELENYLLVPTAIARVIRARTKVDVADLEELIDKELDSSARKLQEETLDGFAAEVLAGDRRLGAGGANKRARELMVRRQAEAGGLTGLVSGKGLISRLSAWSQEKFGTGFGSAALARELRLDEIDRELRQVLSSIERGEAFAK